MKIEETKPKHWLKLAKRQLKLDWQFVQIEHIDNNICKIIFETETGKQTDYPSTIELEFQFDGFKNVNIWGPIKNYIGYILVSIDWIERKHNKQKEYGVKFGMKQNAQFKSIEILDYNKAFIVVS